MPAEAHFAILVGRLVNLHCYLDCSDSAVIHPKTYVQVLDTNDSDSISWDELCVGVKKLVCATWIGSIWMDSMDFMILTRNSAPAVILQEQCASKNSKFA